MKNLNRRQFLTLTAGTAAAGAFWFSGHASAARKNAPPNIVLIVSDDQGYADASCYDHPKEVSTPNIDRLARQGVRLTNAYASAYVCAPTRAGLLTGRYQQRFGFYTGGDSRTGLPLSEVTIADLLKKQGYATAVIGKWHVGIQPQYRPLKRGFDEFYGFLGHGAHDYFDLRITDDYTSIYRNDKPINDTGYLTRNLARHSVSFIERNRSRPFFLYLPFNAVHWPLQAPPENTKRFNTGNKDRKIYLSMLACMDEDIGDVLDARNRRHRAVLVKELPGTRIVVSHDLDFVWDTCERTVLLRDGRVVADGAVADVLSSRDLLESNGLELPLRLQARP